ncbi:hypothetical protein ABD91_20725 [Lysinibacillus sphaericus]|uniref:hypothetical protein n=1 Tax=Lysinibacillus sphaericus TaxID=1421 RepID=UPI0018CEAB6F|nr:hypothetical protein [Lysinibacillus sphaericus]MBG9693168.1 hypothetical protein [Lysinibacillus sphaericus]
MNEVVKELNALYVYQERTKVGAAAAVLNATPKQLQDYITDYVTASYYGHELVYMVGKFQQKHESIYRGTFFEKSLLEVGNVISIGSDLISTTKSLEVAKSFASLLIDNGLDESIYESYADEGVFDPDSDDFEQNVEALYANVIFKIDEVQGLYLNDFYDYDHKFIKEEEVLIYAQNMKFEVQSVQVHEIVSKKDGKDVHLLLVELKQIKECI